MNKTKTKRCERGEEAKLDCRPRVMLPSKTKGGQCLDHLFTEEASNLEMLKGTEKHPTKVFSL